MSALSKLKKISEQPKGKKSSSKLIEDKSIDQLCDDFVKASKAFKNAESLLKQKQAELIEYMNPIHADYIERGTINKSYKVNEKVTCIFTDRFSAIKQDDLEEIKQILNSENVSFDRLFREKVEIKLKKEIEDNEKELEKLIEILGSEENSLLTKYFDLKFSTIPVDDFDKAAAREGIFRKIKDFIERIRYKPTVKVS